MTTTLLRLMAASSLLALAACSQDDTAAQTPPTTSQAQEEPAIQPTPQQEEAADDIRDGASQIGEGLRQLGRDAMERTERALEDAGPMLERAGEVAGQIGSSVEEIVRQAADDLASGARLLEERIRESTQDIDIEPSNPAAILSPADELRADTRAAARALSAGVGPDYIGVWAGDAASCSAIDRETVEMFAVITPSTIRRSESVCNIDAVPLSNGTASMTASCIAEGMEEDRQVTFTMSDRDRLTIAYDGMDGGAEMVRCHLPD